MALFAKTATTPLAVVLLLALQAYPRAQSGSGHTGATRTPHESHRQMLTRLHQIAERDRTENPYYSDRPLRTLLARRTMSPPPKGSIQEAALLSQIAQAQLDDGKVSEAITNLNEAYAILQRHPSEKQSMSELCFTLGMAWFRLAENENCCAQYSPSSCIVPLRPEAFHEHTRGASTAIRYFEEVLRSEHGRNKTRLKSIWLLNLAHMTLGGYPSSVPSEYRIPPSVFQSRIVYPQFSNVAEQAGLDTNSLAGGVVIDDFDGDNDLDVLVSSWDMASSPQYFENRPGGFANESARAGFTNYPGGLNMTSADYDNDGDLDVYISRGAWLWKLGKRPDSLLQNQGDGTFLDVTLMAGLGDQDYPSQTSAWADYDNDGDLDLFVGNEHSETGATSAQEVSGFASPGDEGTRAPSQLFRNNGDGTFSDVAEKAGVTNMRFAKGCTWGDIDGDRWPDLVVSNFGGPNRLYHNQGDGTFVDIAKTAGIEHPEFSFPVWTWDYDNDGVLDIFICSYRGSVDAFLTHAMGKDTKVKGGHYRGSGNLRFQNMSAAHGLDLPVLTMGANFGDINNDGFLDFYLGTGQPDLSEIVPNQMFYNSRGEGFVDITMSAGLGHLQKGHAIAFADVDSDGDLDIFQQMGGAKRVDQYRDALFANPGTRFNWLEVKLVGTKSNRSAIGARIRAIIVNRGVRQNVYRHVNSGASFGANPLRQHLGLGDANYIEELEIYWPTSDTKQLFQKVRANQVLQIEEGRDELIPLSVSPRLLKMDASQN